MIVTLKLYDHKCKTFVTIDLFNVKEVIFIHSINKASLVFNDGSVQDVCPDSIDIIRRGVSNET